MSRKIVVLPEDYSRVIQELSDDQDPDPGDLASDCDETENFIHSEHDSASKIVGEPSKLTQISSLPFPNSSMIVVN